MAGEGAGANRFIVGDVKRSIYGFRLAAPEIFQRYARDWESTAAVRVLALSDNFRSHESLLGFINSVFLICSARRLEE